MVVGRSALGVFLGCGVSRKCVEEGEGEQHGGSYVYTCEGSQGNWAEIFGKMDQKVKRLPKGVLVLRSQWCFILVNSIGG